MIEINLVPKNLRKKKKGKLLGGFNIPLEVIIGLGGGLLFLLIGVHFVLLFVNMKKLAAHKELKQQWESILPSKQRTDVVVSDLRALQGKVTAIEEVTSAARSHWAIKLNVISDTLLRGVWLRKIVLDTDTFFIEGSAISTQRNEMANVHDFTSQLKESEGFLQGFDNFELGSIQRRKIGKTELADFLFTADLEIK